MVKWFGSIEMLQTASVLVKMTVQMIPVFVQVLQYVRLTVVCVCAEMVNLILEILMESLAVSAIITFALVLVSSYIGSGLNIREPNFRNPNGRTNDSPVYGCLSNRNIRSGVGE